MKNFTSALLQVMGFALVIAFGINMFIFFTMDDALWIMMLMLGVGCFFWGNAIQDGWSKEHKALVFMDFFFSLVLLIIKFSI